MKRVLSFACLFTFAIAVSLAAQQAPAKIASDADYMATMKEVGPTAQALGKAIKGNMADEATKAAARLQVLFKNVHAYWSEKKTADATTASQTVLTNLGEIQKALKANDMAAAETARAAMATQCMACHKAHREKLPDGGFKIIP
jgi:cytochrome c556